MRLKALSLSSVGLSILLALVGVFTHFKVANATGPRFLRVPFDDVNNSLPLYFYFDHNYPNYGHDGEITVYTGESVNEFDPFAYEGHSGYDWPLTTGTSVLAAGNGTVETCSYADTYGNYIVIDHQNGYQTLYAHLRSSNPCNVIAGQNVSSGDLVGWSGNTGNSTGSHLHFGVYIGEYQLNNESNATDPFGWTGQGLDPLLQYGIQHTAECLWRSYDDEAISCFDTIVEDAGAGFTLGGTWLSSEIGNGFHMYFRSTTTGNDHALWCLPTSYPGIYKFYAWIPWENAYSQSADYGIWTIYGWETVTIDQQSFSNEWVPLGTFPLDASINPSCH